MSGDLSEFCADCPVVNRRSAGQTQVTLSVPFSIGCAAVCQSDLSVSAAVTGVSGSSFVIGESNTLNLDVNVTNAGEPASLPQVQVSPSARRRQRATLLRPVFYSLTCVDLGSSAVVGRQFCSLIPPACGTGEILFSVSHARKLKTPFVWDYAVPTDQHVVTARREA